jgi:hypothetical protein
MSTDSHHIPDDVASALTRSAEPMTGEAHERVRHSVMTSIRHDSRAHYFASISHRVAAVAATIGLLGTGVAYAAESAEPGDVLYALKRGAEDALVAILPPGALENKILVGVAGRRAEEAANLAAEGAADQAIADAIAELRQAVIDAEAAAGPLTTEQTAAIQEQAQDAPVPTRERISNVVTAPYGGGTDSGTDDSSSTPDSSDGSEGSGTTPGSDGQQGGPGGAGNSGDTTGGAGSR